MSTLGKVLLVLVFLASLGFLYVCARAMKTQDVFRTHYNEHVKALAERDKRIRELDGRAKDESPLDANVRDGYSQLSHRLEMLVAAQGRAWRDCPLGGRNNNVITIQVGDPNGISTKNVLYLFEQHPQPATYEDGIHSNNRPLAFIGEFAVTQVAGNQLSLQPTRRLTTSQTQALANSQGPFACYEQLPVDQHGVWSDLKKYLAERNRGETFPRVFDGALVDAATVKEFQRDGEPAAEGDLDERVLVEVKFLTDFDKLSQAQQTELRAMNFNIVNLRTPAGDVAKDAEGKVVPVDVTKLIQKDAIAYFMRGLPGGGDGPAKKLVDTMKIAQEQRRIYVRQLRDYGLLFREVLVELPVLENRIQELAANIATKKDEKAKLDADNAIQLALQKEWKTENDTLNKERAAAKQVQDELTSQAAEVKQKIAKLAAENKRLSLMLKQVQLEEAERINREAREKVTKEGN